MVADALTDEFFCSTWQPSFLCPARERVKVIFSVSQYASRWALMNSLPTQVRVHRYVDGTLALFHGPRKLAAYDAQGNPFVQEMKQAA